ncbi:MAG: hypothetical protein O3C43_08500 [Verrucomicrobia bacterium]|nr:hypothetical protein [Verrucomicrobiota bacterium]MDA1066527.1 hypothetical protein [Verrucomicrobiota bacterium]
MVKSLIKPISIRVCAFGVSIFFLGCSSDSSDSEKQDVEKPAEVKTDITENSESILSLFDDSSSFELSGSTNQNNDFFLHNSPNVSNTTGEFPERANLSEWFVLLNAKNKHEVITLLGMPDRTYNSGAVFCYYSKLRSEISNNLHLAFHPETLMVEKMGWDSQSLKPIETYDAPK